MSKRAHIPLKRKLASTIVALLQIPHEHAKQMSEEQVLSLVHFDHNELHTLNQNDAFWNLTPVPVPQHREKSRGDTSLAAKSERISKAHKAWVEGQRRKMLAPTERAPPEPKQKFKRQWPSRPLQSRGFR